jgi:hypothetical protein
VVPGPVEGLPQIQRRHLGATLPFLCIPRRACRQTQAMIFPCFVQGLLLTRVIYRGSRDVRQTTAHMQY